MVLTRGPRTSGAAPVINALESRGVSLQVADLAVGLRSIAVRSDNSALVVHADGSSWTICPTTTVFAWHEGLPFFDTEQADSATHRDYARRAQSSAWAAVLASGGTWINSSLSKRGIGGDKVLQQRLARQAGLTVIPTLLTDSIESFVEYVEGLAVEYVALKSVIPWQDWTASTPNPRATYTRRLSKPQALELAHLVPIAPVYVQPYVDKAFEVRAYVIGERVLACSIDSQASEKTRIDWRHYDLAKVRHDAYELPDEVERALVALVSGCGLIYAAIDLIVEPSGTHRFVELNPSGHYGWIEELAALPITSYLVDELLS